ncbi:MAG: AraC family transcriptional regulator [Aureispira sp.]|nr:AraC family transcriptional regulator [Aureispira sp.]
MQELLHVKTIAEGNKLLGLNPPKHPLITVNNDKDVTFPKEYEGARFASDMYFIAFKDRVAGSLDYGRNSYDFQEGTMIFVAPNQVMTIPELEVMQCNKGWSLLFHPDLIRKSHLGGIIKEYSFFSYEANEALHLSIEEREHISTVVNQIKKEYSQNIDKHSQRLIISNLELLLNYCMRFYDRQFYTRTNLNKDFTVEFEKVLNQYLDSKQLKENGIPAVSYFGEQMNMSPNYLSDLLKKETGKSAKGHINDAIIDRAKTVLLHSKEPISQIAYEMGFEYPQSFTRLFKSKTGHSPVEYRSLN